MDDQSVGSPLGPYDPTSEANTAAPEDIESSYPPPGLRRGRTPAVRTYEDSEQLAAAAPTPSATLEAGEQTLRTWQRVHRRVFCGGRSVNSKGLGFLGAFDLEASRGFGCSRRLPQDTGPTSHVVMLRSSGVRTPSAHGVFT
jgi:hypothetical protein